MADEYLYDKKPKILKYIRKTVLFIAESAVVVVIAALITHFALEKTVMVGESMANTFQNGDVLIVNKLAYRSRQPERNDVIVFNQGKNEHSYYNVKRVVAIPGDTIRIADGLLIINDEIVDEEINVEKMRISGLAETPVNLQENEYFVLGDNRNNSEDSRFANIGLIVTDDIIGKAFLRISPEFALVNKLNLK